MEFMNEPKYDKAAVAAVTKEARKIGREAGRAINKALQEKELTWQDVEHLQIILADMIDEDIAGKLPDMGNEEFFTEAARRFNEWRTSNKQD